MPTETAVTVRMKASLRQRLEARARREHRSLSRQIVAELEANLEPAATASPMARPRLLGMFQGQGPVPTGKDFADLGADVARRLESRLRKSARVLAG